MQDIQDAITRNNMQERFNVCREGFEMKNKRNVKWK